MDVELKGGTASEKRRRLSLSDGDGDELQGAKEQRRADCLGSDVEDQAASESGENEKVFMLLPRT